MGHGGHRRPFSATNGRGRVINRSSDNNVNIHRRDGAIVVVTHLLASIMRASHHWHMLEHRHMHGARMSVILIGVPGMSICLV